MNPFGRNAALLLAGVLLVYVPISAGSQVRRCSQSEERCLPIRNCPLYYSRSKANEHNSNRDFGTPVSELKCQPEHRIDDTQHICCPKEKIRCSLGTHPGFCTRPERCPAFSKKNKPELVTKNVTNLCYIHNNQSYVCCPDLHLAMHEHQMEAGSEIQPKKRTIRESENKQSISAFPRCSQDGRAFLVPKPLCDCEYTFVRGSSKACCKLPDTDLHISHPNAGKLAEMSCGRQELPLITRRIILGNQAERGEFPWMTLLVYKEGVKAFCGGTLIHPRYVLTAAHCIKKYPGKLLKVHLGEHNLVPHTRSPEIQEISIEKEITHHLRDIGLLKLLHAAELVTGKVEPICLPLTKRILMHLPSTLIISGWGKTEHFRPKYAVTNLTDQPHPLLKGEVNVLLSSAECTQDYQVCTGGRGDSNTCYGDSGGPYQAESSYNGSKRFVQYAVISSGPAFCESVDRPSRGILVSYFMQWILDMMEIE